MMVCRAKSWATYKQRIYVQRNEPVCRGSLAFTRPAGLRPPELLITVIFS